MIHINLDEGDFRTSGTGSTLLEEHRAITSRIMNYMKESGMDKAWIFDQMQKNLRLSLAATFPEVEDSEETESFRSVILSDFFKKK